MRPSATRKLVIGIDPGTGVNSPMGFAAFTPSNMEIIHVDEFWTEHKKLEHRIRDISDQFNGVMEKLAAQTGDELFIEYFVMRGKGGETLQRMIGSIMGRTPYEVEIDHVQNTSVKLIVGGDGKADKVDVARGLRDFFSKSPKSKAVVQELINNEKWDQLDALAIGLAGWHRSQLRQVKKKDVTKKKAKQKRS